MGNEKKIANKNVSLEEYQEWEESKKVKSNPNPNNENVIEANEISIIDYAKKNALQIRSETQERAEIIDPVTNQTIYVNKKDNTWHGKDMDEQEEGGKMIRFYLKVNRIYPKSQAEYIGNINKLFEEKHKYMTYEEYNKEYRQQAVSGEKEEQSTMEKRERKSKHAETMLANQVSIMDFAKKNNFVISYEDDKIAKIQDVVSEEDITVFKGNNTWSVPENGKTTGGRTIRFVARMQEMTNNAASDMLVENRAKYCSSQEYNEEYGRQHGLQVGPKVEPAKKEQNDVVKQEINDNADSKERKTEEKTTKNVSQEKRVTSPSKSVEKAETEKIVITDHQNEIPMPTHYSKLQIAEILAGTKRGLDIKVFDKIELRPEQMRELRVALEKDINLSRFAFKQVPADYIKEVRLAAQDGLDIKVFNLKKKECVYSAEQAREIRLGLKAGLSQEQMKVFARKDLKPDVMRELRLGLQDGLNVMTDFNNGLFTAKDIHTVRMHLMVKQFIESLKQKMSMLFEQVREAIRNSIEKRNPEMKAQEIVEETDMQIKDTVKYLYEAIEESISERNVEEKKEILAEVFQKVVAMGNAIEEIYPEQDKGDAYKDAASHVGDTIQQNALKSKAMEVLKNDYAEKFAESEQQHNFQVVEITEKLMNEPELSAEQKKGVLMANLNYEFSESAIDSLMEHMLPNINPIRMYGVLEKPRELDNASIFVVSENAQLDAIKAGMTMQEYIENMKKINPQFKDVYIVNEHGQRIQAEQKIVEKELVEEFEMEQ